MRGLSTVSQSNKRIKAGSSLDLRTGKCRHDASLELRRYKITQISDEIWVDLL